MTTEYDNALAELRAERESIDARIELAEQHAKVLDAQIRGMEEARKLLAPCLGAEDTRRRIAVQGPVMALFSYQDGDTWTEDRIIERSRLPEASVHKFLVRAVQKGLLLRVTPDEYGLPAPVKQEAAE